MKIKNASLSWLDSGLPYSSRYEDVYYSRDDELAESQHVFIEGNNLLQRWADSADAIQAFSIAELGFGSGLNFMQVAKLWSETSQRPSRLNYLAFEKHPLSNAQLQKIHQRWPELAAQSHELQQYYPEHSAGCHRLCLNHNITLDLYYGDAFQQLESRYAEISATIDCWFLDGFSPRLNPALWEPRLFQLIAKTCNQNTTLSTYSVAGTVRHALTAAGFAVEKLPGHGKKRHMLHASRATSSVASNTDSKFPDAIKPEPWFELPGFTARHRKAVVIGAGLAGCSTAYSLAQRGWQVTVFDSADRPVAGASGNNQLALRCRFFKTPGSPAQFFLHSFLFASRQFHKLREEAGVEWHDCGVLQLNSAMNKRNAIRAEDLAALYAEQIVRPLSLAEASEKAGVPLSESAWHIPTGGWINPESLCQAYLSHPNIALVLSSPVTAIEAGKNTWSLGTRDPGLNKSELIRSEVVIIANSYAAQQFAQCRELPLLSVRGQITELQGSRKSRCLKTVVSGERTVFPLKQESHVVSASYSSDNSDSSSRAEENLNNLRLAADNFADSAFLGSEAVADRVSQRCNSIDHLPVVGMLADTIAMRDTYAQLGKNANAAFQNNGSYLPGLYINVGHGSNGLASCPLSGEFLAALINGDNLPLSKSMINSISPARFLIRDLKKQKR
ncbi:MAG: bifunctional tRNA (5-methylaminomethyl-2-thiouridine)(34)-methyltransferase MnmD/FAD-dependent 5-carboxymethylaminomethyl-2-thiouridine(34) oxidoreductase MnmC [Pseudohongiella sp.]|nr:bifunctional tRNA (5-methylaminomethyl-2-thiouridine)(34)-methyltransferase MnmD/FAD-dependent 5-carboxymethylaminomethyl-2-thiouridine(34) oxidoreductase MnmC [Pseudohongiella sp.]